MKQRQGITFRFKQFGVADGRCGLRLGTDGVLLGAWARLPFPDARYAADIGTGCGIIALMAAQRFPQLNITAVDVDPGAIADATENFIRSPWAARLSALNMPFENMCGPVDMLLSNPPFFSTGERSPSAARAASRHTSTLSPDTLIGRAAELLSPRGSLQMITPADMEAGLTASIAFSHLSIRRMCRVTTVEGKLPSRILWEITREESMMERSSLTLRLTSGELTPEWHNLTSEFYLDHGK